MKLIRLSAFQGRLLSEIMEWPDWPPDIRMRISQKYPGPYALGKEANMADLVQKEAVAVFHMTGKYETHNGQGVAIYEMVQM